jgi:hypothetical protein
MTRLFEMTSLLAKYHRPGGLSRRLVAFGAVLPYLE